MNKFEYGVISDVDYEDLVVDIFLNDISLATLIQEEGYKLLRIRFFYPFDQKYWTIPLEDFLDVLLNSKKELWRLRKIDTPIEWESDAGPEYVPQLEIILDSHENDAPQIHILYQNKNMVTLYKVNNRYLLKIYPNNETEQRYNIPQWDILFKEFFETIDKATALL